MNKKIALLVSAMFFLLKSWSTDLKVENTMLYFDENGTYAQVWISWKNAWRTDKNKDGVWLFFKMINHNGGYIHGKVSESGHTMVSSEQKIPGLEIQASPDSAGLFISLSGKYRGDVSAVLKIALNRNQFRGIRLREYKFEAFGVEMVHIPNGSHSIGDSSSAAVMNGAFFQSAGNGKRTGIFNIKQETDIIEIADEPGALYYNKSRSGYEGDQKGPIPSGFPKGVNGFLIMKYEPTQELYATFLNSLPKAQQQQHARFLTLPNYLRLRGTIMKDSINGYFTTIPQAPCNFITWSNALSLADWCALRPMTDLEFSKASRGTGKPQPKEFAWGTASKYLVKRAISEKGQPYYFGFIDEKNLSDNNLVTYGASYYWVMDLAGSTWERVITLGHEDGRKFAGSHGDGMLDATGWANNADWPAKTGEGGGFGFRGGGFYVHGRDYHEYNPFSPIEYRPYGSWAGHESNEAYGCRFVRTW